MEIYAPSVVGSNRLLWSLLSANMNSTADQALTKALAFNTFALDKVLITNASTSLTLAVGGFYSAASKGGDALVANTQVYSGLTGGTLGMLATLAALGLAVRSDTALYLALTTAQGGAATADIRLFGWVLS